MALKVNAVLGPLRVVISWTAGPSVIMHKLISRIQADWCHNVGWGCNVGTTNVHPLDSLRSISVDQATGAEDVFEMISQLGNKNMSVFRGKHFACVLHSLLF